MPKARILSRSFDMSNFIDAKTCQFEQAAVQFRT